MERRVLLFHGGGLGEKRLHGLGWVFKGRFAHAGRGGLSIGDGGEVGDGGIEEDGMGVAIPFQMSSALFSEEDRIR